ncbi:DsbA family protein [Roseicyclus mahoneyensis]|uniref:Protein-disulfide isomerase n=1 Tax=Roseicyclus mahoneyensis TaxID=164332 RepID=A0A316GGY4_9RHOB|nr:DsbA family protein [Roseicyclus mahoneyensis]PWK59869.1 protein-disulfide isomerase [Roseicyclus mahoneyensis]
MDRRTILMGAGAGVMAAGTYALLRPVGAPELPLLPQAANAQGAEASSDLPEVVEMVLGSPDAPVEVIEYASFTCPHCATFHLNTLPLIKANYIETGLVRLVSREVYFDRFGLWAGMVARCAGPERYFGVVDLIYQRQDAWRQGAPGEVAENLRQIGRIAGLSNEQLDACLTDAAMAEAMIANYEANMAVHDIPGTPHFVIDGTMHSNMSYEDFAAILDERVAAAQ